MDFNKDRIRERLIEFVKLYSPDTVEQLLNNIQREFDIPREIILDMVIELEEEGFLTFKQKVKPIPHRSIAYLLSVNSAWFWGEVILSIATILAIYLIPGKGHPLIYARYVLSTIFMLFLPGFSFIKVLYPVNEIDVIERVALSIGSSMALVPLFGLLLNYTPWGIKLDPITLSVFTLIIVLSIIAVYREQNALSSEK